MARTPTEILRSLVADIEAMQRNPDDNTMMQAHEYGSNDPGDFFGSFTVYAEADGLTGGAQMVESELGVSVEWPNLRILLDEAKTALKETPTP